MGLSIGNERAQISYHERVVVLVVRAQKVELAHGAVIGFEADNVLLDARQTESRRLFGYDLQYMVERISERVLKPSGFSAWE